LQESTRSALSTAFRQDSHEILANVYKHTK
jgi:hypothetical protein